MRRRPVFLVVTFLFPFLVIAAVEFSLRLAGYGENLDLVIKKEVLGRQFYSINRTVAKRYFAGNTTTIPEPPEDLFAIDKDQKTVRIFCLGESTMAGFPYDFNATAPAFLESELKSLYPGYTIEVINVGLSAVGTFVVHDFLTELLDYQPDLFVVYVGHNEFYGAFGPASSVGASLSPWITDLSIALTRFKTFLALRDLSSSILSGKQEPRDATLMEQMVARQSIPYESEAYEFGEDIYSRNIERIIDAAQEADVPLMFSALVSNIADHAPFLSIANSSLSVPSVQEFREHLEIGDSLLNAGAPSLALEAYNAAVTIDQQHAGVWFAIGQAERRLGDSVRALQALIRARDLDALRFRMSDEFQRDLRTICERRGVPVSPADSVFASASPLNLTGKNLILEHLHPTIGGYALLAHTWTRTILQNSLLSLPATVADRIPSFNEIPAQLVGVTSFDSAVGQIRIAYLTHRWPFREDMSFTFVPVDPIEGIALRYVRKEIPWQAARYEAASYHVGQQRFDLARNEAAAVAAVIPFSYEPLLRIADYYLMEGKRTEAAEAYGECLSVEENPYAYSKLGLIHLHENRFADAIAVLNKAFLVEGRTRYRLTAEMAASNRYLLGFAYARQRKKNDAIREIKSALAINPRHSAALELLSQLEKN